MDRISSRSLAARLFGASPARTLALVQAAWPLAVGPELARRTEVIGIEGGTLRVRVPDAAWRKVLHRIQPQILGRLRDVAGDLAPRRMGFLEGGLSSANASGVERRAAAARRGVAEGAGGCIRDEYPPELPNIERRLGNGPTSRAEASFNSPPESPRSAPPEIEDIKALESQARTIADAEIRARFVETAARYLARAKDAKGTNHA